MTAEPNTQDSAARATAPPSSQIEVFYGQLSPMEVRVYVRLPSVPGGKEWRLSGSLRGPDSDDVRTLPVTTELLDLGAGSSVLATGQVLDPCFWSVALPARYRLEIELYRDAQLEWSTHRLIGFRNFGRAGGDLRFEARRWVLRGVWPDTVELADLEAARLASAALVVTNPTSALCEQASRMGVLLVVHIVGGDPVSRLRQLAHFPAVVMVLLSADNAAALAATPAASAALRSATENVLLGQYVAAGESLATADWADVVFWEVHEHTRDVLAESRPVVAVRHEPVGEHLGAARLRCDRLQSELAPRGEFAGYIVASPIDPIGAVDRSATDGKGSIRRE